MELINNGTEIKIDAQEVIDCKIEELHKINRKRIKNIQGGNR